MAIEDDIDKAWAEARLALLNAVARMAGDGQPHVLAERTLNLAEAYAWLTSTEQPH